VKKSARAHMVMDGGMGDNLEPSLYGQRFIPLVIGRWDAGHVFADLVGRHCELEIMRRWRGAAVGSGNWVPRRW
jgi:diaminopimelate decarboxylase